MAPLRIRALLTSVALVASAGVIVGVTDVSATAASSNVITTTSPGKPIASEKFIVRGKLVTAIVRPVQLQRYTSNGWKTVKSGATKADGKFAITTATTAKKIYRVYAPETTVAGKTYGRRITTKRTVTPVPQVVTVSASRSTVDVSQGQSITITIKNSPVREGRQVGFRFTFEGDTNSGPAGQQDENGRLVLPLGTPGVANIGTYTAQAYAVEANGAKRKYSNKVTFKVIK